MTVEDRMDLVLSTLRAADSVEALKARWPGLLRIIRQLEDQAAKRRVPALRMTRPTIDPRDGSVVRGASEIRLNLPIEWQDFTDVLYALLESPTLQDPGAAEIHTRVKKAADKIGSGYFGPKRPTKTAR